ncbi:hypothetical protein OE88DRAFT_1655078 [Heliocybe sulcata]|uniref:F-box domain-containing protein n=1 Tax=Heliocybe sulcata TaxID=5364 RepID=A0A5C3NBR6_9AGAM|nr:hypothetical protein OE88DRAFT_1655078 [Heliocybe sulcata]
MHAVFYIPEILTAIFRDVVAAGAPRHSLAVLASVCKAWKEVALDEGWQVLPSVQPLLKILPHRQLRAAPGKIRFAWARNFTRADWARLQYYAQRVRNLRLDDKTRLSPVLSLARRSREAGSPLLPNLRMLQIDHPEAEAQPQETLSLLATKSLRHLDFLLDKESVWLRDPQGFECIVDMIATLFPALEQLEFKVVTNSDEPEDEYEEEEGEEAPEDWCIDYHVVPLALKEFRLPYLKVFRCHLPICLDDFFDLGKLPHLEDVDLRVNRETWGDEDGEEEGAAAPTRHASFPALRELGISGPCLEDVVRLLGFFQKHSLESLKLAAYTRSATTAEQIETILRFAGRTSNPGSFRELLLHCKDSGFPDYQLNIDQFKQHLYKCANLEQLQIGTLITVNGTDPQMEEMALTWPKLQYLWLGNWPYSELTRFTLEGLRAFRRHCPELHALSLAVDARMSVAESDVEMQGQDEKDDVKMDGEDGGHERKTEQPSHPLEHLCIANSAIGATDPVAKLLGDMFPNLTRVEAEDVVTGAYGRWVDVRAALSDALDRYIGS